MSRVANSPVALPSGVEVKLSGQDLSVKGAKGQMEFAIHNSFTTQWPLFKKKAS